MSQTEILTRFTFKNHWKAVGGHWGVWVKWCGNMQTFHGSNLPVDSVCDVVDWIQFVDGSSLFVSRQAFRRRWAWWTAAWCTLCGTTSLRPPTSSASARATAWRCWGGRTRWRRSGGGPDVGTARATSPATCWGWADCLSSNCSPSYRWCQTGVSGSWCKRSDANRPVW